MKKLQNDLIILLRGYKLIFLLEKSLIPLVIISSVSEAIFPFISVYMGAEIINALIHKEKAVDIIILVVITLVLIIIVQQLTQITTRIANVKRNVFDRKFEMHLNNKILEMDYACFENPDIHMKRQYIDDCGNCDGGGISKLLYSSKETFASIATIITSITLTFKAFTVYGNNSSDKLIHFFISPAFSIVLLVITVGNTFLSIYLNSESTKKNFEIIHGIIPLNRFF